ncbi:putative sperm motility kinase W [Sycon ciliatum]|uniref:putative sperm motility kinase W n=1 Tax=Sycon ciliatum TaxID=27933 RepID=UPI0031F602BE
MEHQENPNILLLEWEYFRGEVFYPIQRTIGDEFHIHELLGYGETSKVYRGLHVSTSTQVAIKKSFEDRRSLAALDREAYALRYFRHPVIPFYFASIVTAWGWCVIRELVEGVTLDLSPGFGDPTEYQAARIFGQLADGLSYIHALGTVHGDICAKNVMVTPEGNVKLIDYGNCRPGLTVDDYRSFSSRKAPELMFEPRRPRGRKADMFDLGRLMYRYFKNGEEPYNLPPLIPANPQNLQTRMESPEDNISLLGLSDYVSDIICQCLAYDPDARIDSSDFRRHHFINLAVHLGHHFSPNTQGFADLFSTHFYENMRTKKANIDDTREYLRLWERRETEIQHPSYEGNLLNELISKQNESPALTAYRITCYINTYYYYYIRNSGLLSLI